MVSIIIVTHNNEMVLDKCLASLERQTYQDYRVVIVDMASYDTKYLLRNQDKPWLDVVFDERNLGFCAGNNIGISRVIDKFRYILFLNPDAFLSQNFLERAIQIIEMPAQQTTGVLSGKILRYNLEADKPTNIFDSTGIFQTWYGKWYDRGQGKSDFGQFDTAVEGVEVPAVCGALMFCRSEALKASQLKNGEYFRESFFMYKDDIDLSLRIRNAGYGVKYSSHLLAWHCRGWKKRSTMSKKAKLLSARNEIIINRELSLVKHTYSMAKLTLAKIGL